MTCLYVVAEVDKSENWICTKLLYVYRDASARNHAHDPPGLAIWRADGDDVVMARTANFEFWFHGTFLRLCLR